MKVLKVIIIVLLLPSVISTYADDENILVTLRVPHNSTLRGRRLTSVAGKTYYAFQDVPYALPPTGARRFKEAELITPWEGILNVTSNTKICPQIQRGSSDLIIGTEDCLVLNVYTPMSPKSNRGFLPVLFYIHGGAYVMGNGGYKNTNPAYFMDEDILVVTINYRLGALGFLTTEDSTIPPNRGLKDQRLALEWTHANIDLFGGDPKNIVIMGQSAGAASVGYQLLGDYEKPLFTGAILASGTSLGPWTYQMKPKDRAFTIGKRLNRSLNTTHPSYLLELLRNTTVTDLFVASHFEHTRPEWIAILPSERHYFRPPVDAIHNGEFYKVPLLFGFNSEEEIGWFGNNISNVQDKARIWDDNPKRILGVLNVGKENATKIALELKQLYTNRSFLEDLPAVVRYSSDYEFGTPIIRHAESASNRVPVYVYQFSFKSSTSPSSIVPGIEGVSHAEDLDFYWYESHKTIPDSEQIIAKRFVKLLVNFVTFKKPMPKDDPLFENVSWPCFESKYLTYMNFGEHFTIRNNPRSYFTVKGVLDKYLVNPVYVY